MEHFQPIVSSNIVIIITVNCIYSSYAGTSLTFDIVDRLSVDEEAQCVTLLLEKDSGQDSNHHGIVPVTLFDASVISGVQLRASGNLCPFMIMRFGNLAGVTTFLETNKDNLRFTNLFFRLQMNNLLHLLCVFQKKRCQVYLHN